jgi:hypothetical protein
MSLAGIGLFFSPRVLHEFVLDEPSLNACRLSWVYRIRTNYGKDVTILVLSQLKWQLDDFLAFLFVDLDFENRGPHTESSF